MLELGFMFYIDYLKKNPNVDFYLGLGISELWHLERTNGIPPRGSFPGVASVKTKSTREVFRFDLGFKVILFRK